MCSTPKAIERGRTREECPAAREHLVAGEKEPTMNKVPPTDTVRTIGTFENGGTWKGEGTTQRGAVADLS